jgi:hypothetical protein
MLWRRLHSEESLLDIYWERGTFSILMDWGRGATPMHMACWVVPEVPVRTAQEFWVHLAGGVDGAGVSPSR